MRTIRRGLLRLLTLGRRRFCPICERRFGRFVRGGGGSRPGAACPVCGSLERHRLVWLYLRERTDLFSDGRKRMLHVAPEDCLVDRLRALPHLDYLTADLDSPRVMVRMDLTDIRFPDDSFDVIYCSHVLEHVENDRKAMAELHRVLRPGGWAIVMVPLRGEATFEDPTARTPAERRRAFGQADHVRVYGRDVEQRLRGTGFRVRADAYAVELGPEQSARMGLKSHHVVLHCSKVAP